MSYFKKFPFIRDYEIQGRRHTGQDITRRTAIDAVSKQNPAVYQEYDIRDGETAHMIADRAYDNPDLFWVILMFNDIHDELEGWPLDQQSLDTYIKRRYENPYDIHHWQAISTGAWVCLTHPEYDRIPITNYEYEVQQNEAKRKIKIPLPSYVSTIVSEHNRLIGL